MTKVMDANQCQTSFAPRLLPTTVVYRSDASAATGEDPDRMLPTLRSDDRPGDVGSLRFEGFGWNNEHASSDLGHRDLPLPLQAAHVAVAQPGVDRKKRHAREVGW
jgi:hypothetical protein